MDPNNENDWETPNVNKEKVSAFTITLNILCHIMMALLVIYLIYKSFTTYSMISWHPSFTAIGCIALMLEATLSLSDVNFKNLIGFRNLILIHWILQALAAICITVGYVTIYIYKVDHHKKHLHSYHAICGLVTTILVVITLVAGIFAKYSMQMRDYIRPVFTKVSHSVLGTLTLVMSAVTCVLGFYTGWYTRNTSSTIQIGSSTVIILITIYVLYKPVKRVFARL